MARRRLDTDLIKNREIQDVVTHFTDLELWEKEVNQQFLMELPGKGCQIRHGRTI